jgi:Xaa-Pro aminopeptidase
MIEMNEDKLLSLARVDGILLFSSENSRDVNFDYFSGFRKPTYSFFLAGKKKMLITSSIDYERALKETSLDVLKLKDYDYKLRKVLKENFKGKTLGIIASSLPLSVAKTLRGYRLVDVSKIASDIRAVKSKKEIKLIKKSCSIANKGIRYVENNLSLSKSESGFVKELEDYLKKFGIDGFAFDAIFASGKRSAFIHPYPARSKKKISKGLGLIDFGVVYKGYCSDVTVPFSFGKISAKQEEMKEAVLEAYEKCKQELKINAKAGEVFAKAESLLSKRGFELKHGLGHGLGLEVHDPPSLSFNSEDVIKRNMVITLEPGVYELNVGGCRLENDFLIASKARRLTRARFLEF